jgi:hypothetical protein
LELVACCYSQLVQRRGDRSSNLEEESRCCEELLDVAWGWTETYLQLAMGTSDGFCSQLKIGWLMLLLHNLKKRILMFVHCKTKDCMSERKPSAAHDGILLRRGFLLLTVAACFEERLAFVADGVTGNQMAGTSVAAISEERKSWQQSR